MDRNTKIGVNKVSNVSCKYVVNSLTLPLDPTAVFSFGTEQRLQCTSCKKVRYRTDTTDVVSVTVPANEKGKDADGKTIYHDVQLTDCIDTLLGSEALEYACPSCATKVQAIKYGVFTVLPLAS
jgi:ubiquitin carboxyl-terminal hydrolase 5/13